MSARMESLRCGHLAACSSTARLTLAVGVCHVAIINQTLCLSLAETGIKEWACSPRAGVLSHPAASAAFLIAIPA